MPRAREFWLLERWKPAIDIFALYESANEGAGKLKDGVGIAEENE